MFPAQRIHASTLQKAHQIFRSNKIKLVDQFGLANQVPQRPSIVPEVLFLGTTNVGKSSLLTALLMPRAKSARKSSVELPRVSKRMGFTRTISVYSVGSQLRVLDSPGYGFKSTSDQGSVVTAYLEAHSKVVSQAYVLLHPKRLLSDMDRQVCTLLAQFGIPFTFVVTKCDRIKDQETLLENVLAEQHALSTDLGIPPADQVFGTSAETHTGIDELRAQICTLTGVI